MPERVCIKMGGSGSSPIEVDLSFDPCQNSQAGGTHSNGVSNPASSITVPVTSDYGIVICTSAIAYDGSSISASDPTLTCSRTNVKLTSHGVSKQEPGSAGALGFKTCSWLVTNPVQGDVYTATFAGSHSSTHWNCMSGISYIPIVVNS